MDHMDMGYKSGWFMQNPNHEGNASNGNNVTSRFCFLNYCIEGQCWLFEEMDIGGLYYDSFGAKCRIQQRIRRISGKGGARNKSRIVRYNVHRHAFMNTELLPFVDSMWTCEGIDFAQGPTYWLISISALPFGIFGEILSVDNAPPPVSGHFLRRVVCQQVAGMLFGMSNRVGWMGQDPNNNAELWRQVWDLFKTEKVDMFRW